jgi:hypothetical protein
METLWYWIQSTGMLSLSSRLYDPWQISRWLSFHFEAILKT